MSSYSYKEQALLHRKWAKVTPVAVPGTSHHGGGKAMDFAKFLDFIRVNFLTAEHSLKGAQYPAYVVAPPEPMDAADYLKMALADA